MRPTAPEWMDDPAVDPAQLAASLRFIRRVNRYLGGSHAILHHLRRWSQKWPPSSAITLLDIATGSADIPLAILKWARRRHHPVHIFALDNHPITLHLAAAHIKKAQHSGPSTQDLHLIRGDALALPFPDRSIDYVLSSMFFHHLPDSLIPRALAEMLRVARRGIIVNDLLRSRFARIAIHALTLFASPIDKHDARLSVKKAWTRPTVESWATSANAPWLRYHPHWASRFTLAGEKPCEAPVNADPRSGMIRP
ncbi:MAG TPA: methyltransferase domain-containing protein [Phycisphaerae bacterium]|nr:methyltransferase domain-containing protein [Phycisphaerae bacterium]